VYRTVPSSFNRTTERATEFDSLPPTTMAYVPLLSSPRSTTIAECDA